MAFVEEWVAATLEHREQIFDSPAARHLVRSREIEKKKANSRFTNSRVRDQWGGRSGMRPMIYRWPLVQSYIKDMAEALNPLMKHSLARPMRPATITFAWISPNQGSRGRAVYWQKRL